MDGDGDDLAVVAFGAAPHHRCTAVDDDHKDSHGDEKQIAQVDDLDLKL